MQMLQDGQVLLDGPGDEAHHHAAFKDIIHTVNASTSPRVHGLGGQLITAVRFADTGCCAAHVTTLVSALAGPFECACSRRVLDCLLLRLCVSPVCTMRRAAL